MSRESSPNETLPRSDVPRGFASLTTWLVEHPVIAFAVLLLLAGGVLVWHQQHVHSDLVSSLAREDAHTYSQTLEQFRTLYTSEVVERLSENQIRAIHNYETDERAVPLPATLTKLLGVKLAEASDSRLAVKLYSPYPFPNTKQQRPGLPDDFAMAAWESLRSDPALPFHQVEEVNGRRLLRYATADVMREACIRCHNGHPDTPKNDWEVGDVRGVLEVSLPIDVAADRAQSGLGGTLIVLAVFGGVAGIGISLVIGSLRHASQQLDQKVRARTGELRESEERLKTIVEHSPEAIVLLDVDEGRFDDANQHALDLFELTREELLAAHPIDVSPEVQPDGTLSMEAAEQRIGEALREGTAVFDWVHHTKSRREIACEVRLVRLPAGDRCLLRASITDISRRKEEERVLREARDAAESANRAKSDFLANMSHEIRTPMNGVLGMTELLTSTPLNDEQQSYLDMVKQSAESLRRLLNDILDFSKIEAGKLDVESVEFSLQDTVARTAKTLAARAAAKGIELSCRIDTALPDWLVGDPGRLGQVIVNLLGNAIKFTDHGEIVMDLIEESRSDDGIVLHVAVRDTGIGIPAELHAKILESFTQADTSTTRQFGGTGLGLAISRQLVELMGGRLWLESEVGEGTTFHFTIACGLGDESRRPERPNGQALEGLPVMVVDDNATNRWIFEEMLRNVGTTPHVAESGDLCLAEMKQAASEDRPYRLVLLDCMMPEVDGFTLAKQIRQCPELGAPPMIMISSGSRPGDVAMCRELGICRYLTKPVMQSELVEVMLDVVGDSAFDKKAYTSHVDEAPPTRSLDILLAEDGAVNQVVARGFLEQWGHRVTLAVTGKEALACAKEHTFDCILMDVQMPEMDGFAATAAIREHEAPTGRHTPIIALTAAAMKGDRQQCLDAGMDGHVAKPIERQQLAAALAKFVCNTNTGSVAPHDPTEDATEATLLDLDEAARRIPGGDAGIRQLAAVLRGELSDLLVEVRQAADDGQLERLQRAAHTMKGAVDVFGGRTVVAIAKRIESFDDECPIDDVRLVVATLEAEVARFLQALNKVTTDQQ